MSDNKLQVQSTLTDLASPKALVDMATTLKKFVVDQELYSNVKGKNFVHVEGWQFAGSMIGVFPIPTETIDLSQEGEIKYKATVDLIRMSDGQVIGRGFAICSSKEATKKSFDEYAIMSMAQTRATGKAFRLSIGWIMKLAGYETTPAEEASDKYEPEVIEPIDAVKKRVTEKLNCLDSTEKIKFIKQVGKMSEKNLIDEDWRRLDLLMKREESND